MNLGVCNKSTTQQDKSFDVKQLANKFISNLSSIDGKYQIDTNGILNNDNLPQLIADIEKSNLTEKKSVIKIHSFIKSLLDSFRFKNSQLLASL